MIEYQVTTDNEDCALAWVTIEPALAGGFAVWFAPYGGSRSASGYEFYGLVDGLPYWRPSEETAREAANIACLEWVTRAEADGHNGCRIVETDGELVLAEIPILA